MNNFMFHLQNKFMKLYFSLLNPVE